MALESEVNNINHGANQEMLSNQEMEELNNLIRDLVTESTNLVIKLATCKCNDTNNCKVFKTAQRIAEIIEKLQEIRIR